MLSSMTVRKASLDHLEVSITRCATVIAALIVAVTLAQLHILLSPLLVFFHLLFKLNATCPLTIVVTIFTDAIIKTHVNRIVTPAQLSLMLFREDAFNGVKARFITLDPASLVPHNVLVLQLRDRFNLLHGRV